jgi:DNA-directed RNA polymerase subunit F
MRKYLTLAEVKDFLDNEAKTRELGKYSNSAREHASTFSKLDVKSAQKLLSELMELKIREEHAVKIVDVLPKTPEEARAILQNEPDIDENKIGKILELIKEYGAK